MRLLRHQSMRILRHLWFPRLRKARIERDRWIFNLSWAQVHQRLAEHDRDRAVELLQDRQLRVIEQHVAMRELVAENTSLRRALEALTKQSADVTS